MRTLEAMHRWTVTLGKSIGAALGWSLVALTVAGLVAVSLDPAAGLAPGAELIEALTRVLLNGIPLAIAILCLIALTGRPLMAAASGAAAYAALIVAGTIKLEQLGLPLLPADFRFLSAGGGATLFSHYIEPIQLILPVSLLAIAAIAVRWEPKRWRPGARTRRVLCSIAGVAGITLVTGTSGWRSTYDGWNRGFEPWSPAETVARLGVVPTLLMYHWELARPDRHPPNRDRVLEFLAEHAEAFGRMASTDGDGVLPDILVVQSESFFDPALLTGIAAEDTLPQFRRLRTQGWSGNLRVPTYAGGTIRTEFEVLSGVPLAAFPGVEYPYFELVDAPMPGLMRTLTEQGYRTTVLHPNDASFWNRRDSLARLGAERFLALPEFANAPKTGLFIADAALTDRMLAELREDGPPQFLFAISMESHGPYEVRPGLDEAVLSAIGVPDTLDEYGARTLRHYLYHLANADRELGRLAAAVQQRARPTVLVFYGDHLPGLHSAFAQLGFRDGLGPRSQPAPYLVLDNRRAEQREEDTLAWMLPALLLEAARVPPDAYLALVGALRHTPTMLLPDSAGGRPEPRFTELARLRVRDEFNLGDYTAALTPAPVVMDSNVTETPPTEEAATN
ncbi:MAG: LTA synthase family protein [Rhodanobacteraceae bacterium]|nr:LTA synthase family protein [Rhodanobacteraceae bacterium]